MKASEIMTPDPEVVTRNETVRCAAEIMRDLDVGFVPVVKDRADNHLEGVITDRDITVRHVAEGHREECKVGDHMTRGRLDSVHPDTDVHEVTRLMRRDQVRRVPVIERDNRVVGIVAQADIAVEEGPREPEEVEETLEEVSKPGRPRR